MHERYASARSLLGAALVDRLRASRVLMVGAGGIGCELLKNLAMSGVGYVELVDLDTIDISNLNRQFLFKRCHVGKSKAHVAKESAQRFNLDVEIVSHHANIKDPQFHVEWFQTFDVVFNALDNLDARRHVNLMCMASNTPLIDAGTGGFTGQSTVILKGLTECYDCYPKPTPKTFPVCTIRSTPSAIIHCIVWAKNYLFSQLFAPQSYEDESSLINIDKDIDNAEELARLQVEANALKQLKSTAGSLEYARNVFDKVFVYDIQRLISMKDMWNSRTPPTPLSWNDLHREMTLHNSNDIEHTTESMIQKDQRILSLQETFTLFINSLSALGQRFAKEASRSLTAGLSFDKDDQDAMDFITSTANLRAHVYGIELKSKFETKAMAGNIVPIVATTNAIISGIAVMQAIAIIQERGKEIGTTYLVTRSNQFLAHENAVGPNSQCTVCQRTYVCLDVNLETTTLLDLLHFIHTLYPPFKPENISVIEGARLLWDSDFNDNCERILSDLGVTSYAALNITVEDANEDNTCIDMLTRPMTVFVRNTLTEQIRMANNVKPELILYPRLYMAPLKEGATNVDEVDDVDDIVEIAHQDLTDIIQLSSKRKIDSSGEYVHKKIKSASLHHMATTSTPNLTNDDDDDDSIIILE